MQAFGTRCFKSLLDGTVAADIDVNVFGSVKVLIAVLLFKRKQQKGIVIQISS
jgi:hypothetical protein